MNYKLFSVKNLILVVFGGFIVLSMLLFSIGKEPPILSKPVPIQTPDYTPSPQSAQASLPVRLKIPRIEVDSEIEHLGLTANGEMDTTKDPIKVAWYQLGQRPGDIGSAVIAGHFGWKDKIPAAFDNLTKLQKGDKVYIEDEKNVTITFVVQDIKIFDKNDDTKSIFSSTDSKSHLNLITCEGAWSNTSLSYDKRLVIFTDKQ